MPDDPDVVRLYYIATVAKEFNQLPSVVARDLDSDPEQLSLMVLPMLRYAEAKAAFDSNSKSAMEAYKGSTTMDSVVKNAFELAKAELEQAAAELQRQGEVKEEEES